MGGRPPYDVVMMFKILVLQRLYNLSDDQTEYLINDIWQGCATDITRIRWANRRMQWNKFLSEMCKAILTIS